MTVLQALEPRVRHNLIRLFGACCLFWASLTMMLPTLPLYVADQGASPQGVGIVIGGFTLGLVAVRPSLAQLADQRSRKLVLVLGILAVMIAPLGYAGVTDLGLLFVLRVLHGVSVAGVTIAASALIADFSPPQLRGEVISLMSLNTPIGMSMGPALGSFVLERYGYGPTFWLAAGLGLVSLGLASLVREPERDRPLAGSAEAASEFQGAFWGLLRSPAIAVPTVVLLLAGLAFGTLMTFLSLYLKAEGIVLSAGLFFSAAAITSFCVRLGSGVIAQRVGRGLLISVGLLSYGSALALLSVAKSPTQVLVAAVVEGGGFGVVLPMILAMLADRARAQERGRVFGLCLMGLDLGGAIAAPVFGALAEGWGYRPLFAIASGCAFGALGVFLLFSSKDLGLSVRFALGLAGDGYALPQ